MEQNSIVQIQFNSIFFIFINLKNCQQHRLSLKLLIFSTWIHGEYFFFISFHFIRLRHYRITWIRMIWFEKYDENSNHFFFSIFFPMVILFVIHICIIDYYNRISFIYSQFYFQFSFPFLFWCEFNQTKSHHHISNWLTSCWLMFFFCWMNELNGFFWISSSSRNRKTIE
mgnify:CR=1 FL=1